MVRRSTGASYPAVSDSIVKAYDIPLPSLEEQKRIAAILDKADAIRRKRSLAIALTEKLLRSTFLDMFGDPVTNPKGWEVVEIKDLVRPVRNWNPIKSPFNNFFVYIDIASINRETKRIEGATNIWTYEAPSRARQLGKTGDVLVSTVRPNLNAVAYLDEQYDGATISTGFTVLRPDNNKLNSCYLYSWVKTKYFIDNMVQQSTGASYPAVTDAIVKASKISLPPIQEQQLFTRFEERIKLSINKMEQITEESDNLFNSLLQLAFRGKL